MRWFALVLLLSASVHAETLPAAEPKGGSLEKVASPDEKRVLFQLFERGHPTWVGVAEKSGQIVWKKNAGIRPLVSTFWSADGASVLVVTDCAQAEAELKSGDKTSASWLLVLDARDGKLQAEGDLDRAVLDLPRQLPDAVGAAHEIDRLTLTSGTLECTIRHRGQPVRGACPLATLARPEK